MRLIEFGFLLIMALTMNLSIAGEGVGKIIDIMLQPATGVIRFHTENHTNKPACALGTHSLAISLQDEMAKPLLAMMLAAQATGNTVRLYGVGNCYPGTNAEQVLESNVGLWSN